MNSGFRTFCLLSALAAAITCLASLFGVYMYVSLLPIAFILYLILVTASNFLWTSRPLSAYIITGLLWMRMVLLPLYGTLSGSFTDNSIAPELGNHFLSSIVLCLYDCIAISLLFVVFSLREKKITRSSNSELYGQSGVYLLFVFLAIIVFFTVGRSMDLFDFAIKPIRSDLERGGDIVGGREMIIRQIVSSGMMFLFIVAIYWLKKKYDRTHLEKYFVFSLICAILLIAIISGERRTAQVYKAFASAYVLLTLYPYKSKKTITYIGVAALFVLGAMTIYKQYYAYMYSSYAEAIQSTSLGEGFSYNIIDAYFYGIGTIAKNIHYGQSMDTGLSQFLYDFFRNIFGLGSFFSDGRLLTSQMYNSIIYSGDQLTGLLLSSVGYGYLFFGYVFAPLVTLFNVGMMLFFEKCMTRSKYIEWQYVFAYVYMRFAFGALGSTPPLINLITRFLVINGVIIGIARLLKSIRL